MVSQTTLKTELEQQLPTPVHQLRSVAGGSGSLWVKNDGLTGQRYGGNKLRKLAPLLDLARQRNCTRLLTVGAAGSHHALATTIYGAAAGFEVNTLLVPQYHTPHAERVLRATIAAGADVIPVKTASGALRSLRRLSAPRVLRIGPGAMGNTGAVGYLQAACELAKQVEEGLMPPPTRIVLALGSGSTAAGLLVGLQRVGLGCTVVGVLVAPNPAARPMVLAQAASLARATGDEFSLRQGHRRFAVWSDAVGRGYGIPTEAGERATKTARAHGLIVDPTYTAKAFSVALEFCRNRDGTTLYWHTLSAASMEPLLAHAPDLAQLPVELRSLLIPTR